MDRGDSDDPIVSDEMIGFMIVFGLDFVFVAGILWIVDLVSGPVFAAVTGLVVMVFASWTAWRWYTLRSRSPTEGDSSETDPLQTLRDRYARGELTEAEFERKLERLLETESIDDLERGNHRTKDSLNRELERE